MNLVVLPPKRMGTIRFGRTTSSPANANTQGRVLPEQMTRP